MRCTTCRAVVLLSLLVAMCSSADAQYFGQNKVRYETYDFKVLKTQHFDIYYYESESALAPEIGRMAERWYTRLASVLNHPLSSRQPVIIYDNPSDFRSTTVIPGTIGEATGGVTEPLQRRVVLPLAGPLAETDHVLGHELVHAFQYDLGSQGRVPFGTAAGLQSLPLWFIEGMAEYLSLGPVDAHTAMWMRDAVGRDDLPKIQDLDHPKYFPYRWGQALWAYVAGRYGDASIGAIFRAALGQRTAANGIARVTNTSVDQLSKDWQQALRNYYAPILESTKPLKEQGRVLIGHEKNEELNVSPAMSPDGKWLMLLSSRSLFSIDLYLADAATGNIKRRITHTAVDPHFNSLEFTVGAGAWSRDSKRFAYPHSKASKPFIAIYDLDKDEVVRDLRFPELGEITTLTWSPDGQRIAFSAMQGGVTDLFITDVGTGKLQRLTNDRFADLQPAWSPDGGTLVFVTDRFTSNLDELGFGEYRLGQLQLTTDKILPLPAFKSGKHIDPQWAADGRSIYFVADHNGISNIYRLSLADHRLSQVTDLQTGVSGITALSPALSVAADRVAYSAFAHDGYGIVTIDSPQQLAGEKLSTDVAGINAAVLPPRQRAKGEVASLLQRPKTGLVSGQQFRTTNYDAGLSLDYIAPPAVAAGASSFGTLVGGGTALHFSDILNFHDLTLQFQTFTATDSSNFLRNLNASATYLNQRTRWNWGFTGGQIPYLSGGFTTGIADIGGRTAVVEQEVNVWQIDRSIAGILQYPFSRAQRIEFTTGYDNISFAGETKLQAFDAFTGELLAQQKNDLATPDALHMFTGATALVYDTAVFGGTSPVLGQRYRLQIGGNAGSLNFYNLLGDYRRYVHLARPVSLAGRALHYGRYGGDAGSERLQPLFVGYDALVRGYNPQSFSAAECGPALQQSGACPVFDRLLGSRIAVLNAELRTQLLGPLGLIPSRAFLPVEIAPFFDAGRAWSAGTDLLSGDDRRWVTSYGASLRINLLGFAIGQISLVHPNDRPSKNWVWQFSLLPGW